MERGGRMRPSKGRLESGHGSARGARFDFSSAHVARFFAKRTLKDNMKSLLHFIIKQNLLYLYGAAICYFWLSALVMGGVGANTGVAQFFKGHGLSWLGF